MKTTIIQNSKPSEKNIPTSWDQVSFRKLMELPKCGTDITKVIALLIDVDHEVLLKSKLVNMEKVIAVLGFLNRPAQPSVPTSIFGYPVPKDLAFEEVQMYYDLKVYLDETKDKTDMEKLAQYPVYCAVYACKHRYGRYDFQLAEKLSEIFFEAPCTEVLGIGNFTLARLIGLNLNTAIPYRQPLPLMKKFRLVLGSWQRTSAVIQRLFTWKKKQAGQVTS